MHKADADLVYPIVSRDISEAQFPDQKRTYAKTTDGAFTGGNMALLNPKAVAPLLAFIDRLYKGRKNPLILAQLFGIGTIISFLLGKLEIKTLEQKASAMLGVEVKSLRVSDASLAADIDKPEHLTGVAIQKLASR